MPCTNITPHSPHEYDGGTRWCDGTTFTPPPCEVDNCARTAERCPCGNAHCTDHPHMSTPFTPALPGAATAELITAARRIAASYRHATTNRDRYTGRLLTELADHLSRETKP